jgi:exonuclease VII small subunit
MTLQHLEERAQRAYNWTSFSPEKRGTQLIKECSEELDGDIKELQDAGADSETIASYKERYERFITAWIGAKSRCASTMITGGSNFNVRRAEKANRSERRHYEVFCEWRSRAIKSIIRKSQPEKTYLSELDRYKSDLEGMKKNHELMKEGNKRIKQAKRTGENISGYLMEVFNIAPHMIDWTMRFGFGLQNSNANIKRVEERIKELESKQERLESSPESKYIFEGGEVVYNYEIDRIQIFFNNRPTQEELTEYKARGLNSFNWSPSNKAWQRKITGNATYAVKRLFPSIKKA